MGKWGCGKVEKICLLCKISFRARRDRLGLFCSRVCQTKGRKKKEKTLIDCKCKECGKQFVIRKGRGGTGDFCSISCMAKARGKKMQKDSHPKWKGGISERPFWTRTLIKKRKKEIGKCENCESIKNLQCHHTDGFSKNPFLIQILCQECHSKEHPKLKNFIKRKYGKEKI